MPLPFPPHVAEDVGEARALYELVKEQGRDGARGIVQGERALGARSSSRERERRAAAARGRRCRP